MLPHVEILCFHCLQYVLPLALNVEKISSCPKGLLHALVKLDTTTPADCQIHYKKNFQLSLMVKLASRQVQ